MTPLRRPRKWTLQSTLTVAVISIVSILLIAVSALTAAVLRTTLDEQLTQSVTATSERASTWVSFAVNGGARSASEILDYDTDLSDSLQKLWQQPGTVLILELSDGISGAYIDSDYRVVPLTQKQLSPVTELVFSRGQPRDVSIADVGSFRITGDFYSVNSKMLLGFNRAAVDSTIGLVIATISALTLGGLLLLAFVIGLTIRRALRPLRAVAATAQRVAAQQLDQGTVTITDRVQGENLDDHTEIGRVGSALNTMLDHVDASLRARVANEEKMRQFVADASHELRTPLASIRGYSELSLRDPSNSENTSAALERIQAQSVRMTRLVEDLLLLARLDEGRELVLAPLDMVPLTIESLADAQVAGPDHSWEWSSELTEAMVMGDAGHLHQVVTNLLANARTHTPAGTHITLTVTRDATDVIVLVHDTGGGIEPSVRETLFERFARADTSRARKTGGTGLGLSIAQAITEAHNGGLSVQSEPGSTTFELRLPALATPHQVPAV